jgi:hypothetical protein
VYLRKAVQSDGKSNSGNFAKKNWTRCQTSAAAVSRFSTNCTSLTVSAVFLGQRIDSAVLPSFDDRPDAFNDMAWQYFRPGNPAEVEPDVENLTASLKKLDV